MDVTVIRHGTAQDRAPSDADRALTATGEAEAARAGERVAQTDPPPDLIVSSPYLRARQTAEAVAARVGLTGQVELDEALVPESPPEGVWELLSRVTGRRHVVLVAHEPILSAVCGLLLGRSVPSLRRAEILSMQSGEGSEIRAGGFTFRFRA